MTTKPKPKREQLVITAAGRTIVLTPESRDELPPMAEVELRDVLTSAAYGVDGGVGIGKLSIMIWCIFTTLLPASLRVDFARVKSGRFTKEEVAEMISAGNQIIDYVFMSDDENQHGGRTEDESEGKPVGAKSAPTASKSKSSS